MTKDLEFSKSVFIIGSPRSGTSVLAWAISKHGDFWTSAESDFLLYLYGNNEIFKAYTKAFVRPDVGWLKKHDISYEEFAAYVGLGIDKLFLAKSSGRRWIDSTPIYTTILDTLADLFPGASFVHIVRDGRAVVNSLLNMRISKLGIAVPALRNFEDQCETWVSYVNMGREFGRKYQSRYLEVRQEQLIEDPESLFRNVFSFLDVPYTQESADLVKTRRLNSSYDKGVKSVVTIDRDKLVNEQNKWGDWSARKVKVFNSVAKKTMKDLGYEVNS